MSKVDSFRSNSKFWRLRNNARIAPQPWQWPLRPLGARDPLVLANMVIKKHGVLLGYEAQPDDAELVVPVYAAQDGDVMFCGETETGFGISIHHRAAGFATYYGHLSSALLAQNLTQIEKRRQRVLGGEVIGYAAKSPVHVRFAIWKWADNGGFVPVEAIEAMNQLVPATDVAKKAA
jgi:hypothetical protein